MTDTADQRSRIESLLSFSDRTTPTSSERAIGDIAGSLRRIAQRGAMGAGVGGPGGVQSRVEALRSEILGTRGSTSPDQVRKALGALGPAPGAQAAGPAGKRIGGGMAGSYGHGGYHSGWYRGDGYSKAGSADGGWSAGGAWGSRAAAAMVQDGRILSASQQVLIARVMELTASIDEIVRTLQPIRVQDPPEPEAVEARRALIRSVLTALVEESRRLEPRQNIEETALQDLDLQLADFAAQMAPDDDFESDAVRRQEAQLALLDADRQDLRAAWDRFFDEGEGVEQVEQVRRQLRVAYGTLGKLRDALRDAGLSDEEADSPEARLSDLQQAVLVSGSDSSGTVLPPITLAAWLDSVADATGDAAQARLSLGGEFALPDVEARADAIADQAAELLEIVASEAEGSSILVALRDPIALEELVAVREQMQSVADLASPQGTDDVQATTPSEA